MITGKREKNDIEMNWELDAAGKLTVTGSGRIPDYSCGKNAAAPWDDIKDRIFGIEITEGITEIGINAFKDCKNLKSAVLPASLFRIRAYAFWNCTQLEDVGSNRTNFQYIYDRGQYSKDMTVIFEIGSFHHVPWAIKKWGEFYCKDDCLYTCFSDKRKLVIPEGIQVLASFSLAYIDTESVRLPNTLKTIQNFVFSGGVVRNNLVLPNAIQSIEPYAFSDCSVPLISFPSSWRPDKIQWKRTGIGMIRRQYVPEYINKYSVGLEKVKGMGKFKRVKIVENKPVQHKDGTVTKVRDVSKVDVGGSVYRRIRNGKVILCISYEDNKISSVKSFSWDRYGELPVEYLLYPVFEPDGLLVPWSDSFTYQEKEDIVYAFWDHDGEALYKAGVLRLRHPDTHEEWFWSDDKRNYGGPLELELLEMWLKEHPDIKVDSMNENRDNDKTRLFVSV